VREKYFKSEYVYRPAGMLVNVKAMIYFKFKFKFRNNKNYSSTIVNFHTGLGQETY
jgi:hypothetical protein